MQSLKKKTAQDFSLSGEKLALFYILAHELNYEIFGHLIYSQLQFYLMLVLLINRRAVIKCRPASRPYPPYTYLPTRCSPDSTSRVKRAADTF